MSVPIDEIYSVIPNKGERLYSENDIVDALAQTRRLSLYDRWLGVPNRIRKLDQSGRIGHVMSGVGPEGWVMGAQSEPLYFRTPDTDAPPRQEPVVSAFAGLIQRRSYDFR